MFTAAQFKVFLRALINLDPFDFADDVAAYFVSEDDNSQQTPDEVLALILTSLPDEKLTGFVLRLALTGHTDIPRESDFDSLAEADAAFTQPSPAKDKRPQKKHPACIPPRLVQETKAEKPNYRRRTSQHD